MRYLTVYTDGFTDESEAAIFDLPFPDNHIASSVWLRIRQVVGSHVRTDNRDVAYSLARWSTVLDLAPALVSKFLEVLAKLGLIVVSVDGDDMARTRVGIPSLLFYADEATRKRNPAGVKRARDKESKNFGTTPERVRNDSGTKLKRKRSKREAHAKAKGAAGVGKPTRGSRSLGSAAAASPSGAVVDFSTNVPDVHFRSNGGDISLREFLEYSQARLNAGDSAEKVFSAEGMATLDQYGFYVNGPFILHRSRSQEGVGHGT